WEQQEDEPVPTAKPRISRLLARRNAKPPWRARPVRGRRRLCSTRHGCVQHAMPIQLAARATRSHMTINQRSDKKSLRKRLAPSRIRSRRCLARS
ncbi:hypothetical protein H9Q74_013732, partial [Fusarium xylarioides]